jgi:hypothetical protein
VEVSGAQHLFKTLLGCQPSSVLVRRYAPLRSRLLLKWQAASTPCAQSAAGRGEAGRRAGGQCGILRCPAAPAAD